MTTAPIAPATELRHVLPVTARWAREGLEIGGVSVADLAERFGTPLYVYDLVTIRAAVDSITHRVRAAYPDTDVAYASKALSAPWLYRVLAGTDVLVDVVSGGELHTAVAAGLSPERIIFHGNYKSDEELHSAICMRVGRIVIDNLDEIASVGRLASSLRVDQEVLLRLNPSVEVYSSV